MESTLTPIPTKGAQSKWRERTHRLTVLTAAGWRLEPASCQPSPDCAGLGCGESSSP